MIAVSHARAGRSPGRSAASTRGSPAGRSRTPPSPPASESAWPAVGCGRRPATAIPRRRTRPRPVKSAPWPETCWGKWAGGTAPEGLGPPGARDHPDRGGGHRTRMPAETPAGRSGARLVDALIVWITPDRQLEPGNPNRFEVLVSETGEMWIERLRW